MAPAQCPRQVLIWSIPAIAVLISFFWYKRRKTSLRSDPGGTTQQKSLELVDSNGSLKTNTVTSVDSNKVIAAIEKAIRDRETSQAIEEVVSIEEEEEIEVIDKAVVKENIGNVLALTEINADDNKDSVVTKSDITDLDSSIISLSDTTFTINSSTSDNDNTIIISSTETSFVGEGVIVKTTFDLSGSINSEDQNTETDDNSAFVILDKKTESDVKESNENSGDKKVITVKNIATVESPLNSNKGNKLTNSNKKRSNKKSNKENSVICNNNNNKTTEVKNKKQDEKVKDKKQLINGGTETSHKEEKSKNKIDESPSAIIGNSDKVVVNETNKKMELSCSRVDHVGHNPSSTIVNGNEAGLEQKLATLGLESSHNHNSEGSGERDSANHSPAEVMLASPSMSTFSDAHSEGSSDSGKGCSDIPDISTPPPQTPAGGSSVSGDLVPSVYEFIIPQYMVGRLIGRHGVFLHDIRSKTHTHIFIKRHPDTTKLKICAIEGAQQDIDAALAMIRQKFPLRRFPNLTLEKVTFVNIMPSLCPLQQEQFQLQLIEGVNNDVILSSLISAGHFFLQQPMHPSYQSLSQLNLVMNTVYSSPEAPALDTPLKDAICAAPAMGGWYRAQIIDVDEDNKTVDVRFLDYGGFLTLETSALRKIRGDLMLLPFQAVECLLANVIPAGGEDAEWTEEARLFVQNLTCGQILQANISEYTEQGIPLVFLYAMYCGQVVVVNQELVARGYAEACTPAISEE